MKTNTEWHKGPDFAEVAEPLGITTIQIIAAMNPDTDRVVVLYTPAEDGTPPVYQARLHRDRDGILRLSEIPTDFTAQWDEITANIDRRMRKRFGPPS